GKNDSDEEIRNEAQWIAHELGVDVPLHFTAFHPDYKMMDVPPTPPETLSRARAIAQQEGLQYVYTGNVFDTEGGTTYCTDCKAPLIVRDWHRILHYRVTQDGRCPDCATPLAGEFEQFTRQFGRRRIPIALHAAR
ncbi:MAG TPA: AmmeMemoRadiSam system radical SAM enzyme, partial [Burkholderiales bacterium]|nr:AmmeMemoRadiSam system radical SAM enzyme [Burkholderiales bacterium]